MNKLAAAVGEAAGSILSGIDLSQFQASYAPPVKAIKPRAASALVVAPASPNGSSSDAEWLTLEQVAARLSVSGRTIRRLVDGDGFPRPRYLTARAPRWRRADVDAWMSSRPSEPQ